MSRLPAVPVSLLVVTLACVACMPPVETMRLTAAPLDPRPAGHPVRLYASAPPRCPVEEVGLVQVHAVDFMRFGLWSDRMGDLLRGRARRLGGDAVVGLAETVEDLGLTTTQTATGSAARDSSKASSSLELTTTVAPNRARRLQGTVVRFTQADCRE